MISNVVVFCLFVVYTQAIILNSSVSLLERYFLPVSRRLKGKSEDLYSQEQSLKHATRLESSEREDLESNLMKVIHTNLFSSKSWNSISKNYEILVRDLYAFGPLLIKYVDIHRSTWLKHGDIYAEELFNNMAEVFSTWCKSKVKSSTDYFLLRFIEIRFVLVFQTWRIEFCYTTWNR